MCVNCLPGTNLNFTITFVTCRVCELLDDDKRSKGVVFCDTCGHYICQSCWTNGVRRALAAVKNVFIAAPEEPIMKEYPDGTKSEVGTGPVITNEQTEVKE